MLKDLPDKLEKNTYVKLEPEQQRIYDAHVQRLKMFMEKQNEKNSKMQSSRSWRNSQNCGRSAAVRDSFMRIICYFC